MLTELVPAGLGLAYMCHTDRDGEIQEIRAEICVDIQTVTHVADPLIKLSCTRITGHATSQSLPTADL